MISILSRSDSSSVANSRDSSFIFFDFGAIRDTVGNNITEFSSAIQAVVFVTDRDAPRLIQFNIERWQSTDSIDLQRASKNRQLHASFCHADK